MTSRETTRRTATRRRALSLAALGATAGLAGCGYSPGPGELAWERARASPSGFFGGESRWLAADDRLVEVRNRNGQTYDFDAEEWVDVEDAVVVAHAPSGNESFSANTEQQFEGMPAASGDGVYLPRVDGRVTAIALGDDAGERLWTTAAPAGSSSDGPPPTLAAGSGLVAASLGDRLVGFDAGTGDERFAVAPDAGKIEHAAVDDRRAWAATGGTDPTLYGFDHGGGERVALSLPSTARWLLPVAGVALVGLSNGGAWVVAPDGTRRFQLDVRSGRAPTVVGTRCYHRTDGRLIAFDLGRGEQVWERDDPFGGPRVAGTGDPGIVGADESLVADADGVYGRGPVAGSDECGLVAVTADGEPWWEARTPDEPGCAGDLYLVGDRLVVVADDGLYGFRTASGSRFSLL